MVTRIRQPLGQRFHDWLAEPEGQQFVHGKWRFWFVAVAVLSVINAVLTWLIFRDDSENYSGAIMWSAGALVAWLCVCALHYSDSSNRRLSMLVSVVDSVALMFVGLHFAGLLYVYGHHRTLQRAEVKYEAAATQYNQKAEKVSSDNVEIARSAERIAEEQTKAARLENDRAYQLRKAAERGARVQQTAGPATTGIGAGLSTTPIELERPTKPTESSAAFLAKWDWAVRAANFGELFLAFLTMIIIRVLTSRSNTFSPAPPRSENYVDAVSPSLPPRGRLGFVNAEDRPPDTRPKMKGDWI